MATTQRSVRVADELWEAYGDLCAARGTDRTAALVEHMQAEIDEANEHEGSTDA